MDILQIVFFAGLAVFLAVQLYRVLGRPTGRSPQDHMRQERDRAESAAPMPSPPFTPKPREDTPHPAPLAASGAEGLDALHRMDPRFDLETFVRGACSAYEKIVLGYAGGDKDTLKPLLTERVMTAYEAGINRRQARKQTVITEIERIKSVEIVKVSLNDNRAKVRVGFSAELASETRDSQGDVVEGDLATLKTVDEVWSFERDITSENPNWRLAAVKPA